jgi:hypothetical protein
MILDLTGRLLNAYSPTSTGTTYQQYIDRLTPMDDGAGEPLYLFGKVTTAVTSGGSATVNFQLVGNPSDPTFSSGNVVWMDAGIPPGTGIGKSSLVAGYAFFRAPIPRSPQSGSYEAETLLIRYWSVAVIIGTAALTAGTFDCWIGSKPLQDSLAYPRAYTV